MSADLGHATLRRKIALENHEATGGLQRLVERHNHFLPRSLRRSLSLLANRQSGNSLSGRIQIFPGQQPLREQSNSARAMHICSHKPPRRLEIAKQGSALTHRLELVNLKRNAGLARN